MAAALAELVLKKLGSLSADQASLLWGLKSEIPKFANLVSSIQAVLLDAEEQSGKSHQVQLWLRGLEDVIYEAEDLLDDFSTEILRRKQMDGNSVVNEVCLFFSPSNQVAYGLKIANHIKAIRSKLEEIDRNRNKFNFQMRPVEPNKEWRQTHSSSVPDVVIGREGDKQIIIDMLLSSRNKEKVAVVPIVGIGGLGKTALAQLVYNDDKIKSHFDSTCWVCVSETFEPKVLVKNVLESITKRNVEDIALNTLTDLLHEQIKNKRLLLVLDDVWNEDPEKWAKVMNILSSGATTGNRILVTTRLPIVAEMTATETIVPHELKGLSKHDSWSLFEKMAFKEGVASSPSYVEIGKKVLRKCCGVPLAIRTMGGLLFFKDTVSEWERIADKQLLNLDLGGQESEILERTLKLSYDNLPSNLKRCFVYCSLFPKDHKINVKMLVQLWMAQGYIIKSSQSSELADIGIGYFKNLLWRSFFQEVEKDRWGNMTNCKMHDLVHDVAVKVAGEETVCLNASNLSNSLLNVNLERIRHLSIDFEKKWEHKVCQLPSLLAKATRLRTFLIINVSYQGVKLEGKCEKIFPNMTRLRVLGLPRVNIEMIFSIIHVLKHLRYFDLSYNKEMKILPNNMTRLINLQVLNLCGCKNLRLLSADIGKLFNLGYLVLDDCASLTCIPAGIGNLYFLRELSDFIVTEAAATADGSSQAAGLLGELKSLNNLSGGLSIRGLERVTDKSEAELANLKEKSQLQCLVLCWSDDKYMNRTNFDADPNHEMSVLEALQPHPNLKELELQNYCGTSIPTTTRSCCWFFSLRNLVRMELCGCRKLRSLPSLDPLVSLEELKLFGLESLEYVQSLETSSSSSNNDFQSLPSLVSLYIYYCPNLIGWSPTSVQDSPLLPGVSRLTISNCPQMVSFPRFRVNFEKVVLSGLNNEVLSVFAASLISPPTHPRFHSLILSFVKDLPQGLTPHLTSLEKLFIGHCDGLITLSPSILRHLPSLQELDIENCPVLELEDYGYGVGDDDENNNTLCVLPSLRRLHFNNVPKLVALPKWLQHSSNLRQLEIWNCEYLKCLPSWLRKLTALESLCVNKCDILSGRCRSDTAEDWPNISSIPNIRIDDIDVRKDGCYFGIEQQLQQQQQQQQWRQQEEEDEEEEESSQSHTQISKRTYRMLEIYFARITCNLFQRCFIR